MRLAVLVNLGSKRFFAAIIINVRIGSVLLVQKISDYLSIKAPAWVANWITKHSLFRHR